MTLPEVRLHKNKEQSLKRFHPWVFSGAVNLVSDGIADGDTVQVTDAGGKYLGFGHFQNYGSIAVRMLGFGEGYNPSEFWANRIKAARAVRQKIGLPSSHTSIYRLIHAEGDNLPGLVVDIYGQFAVLQAHSAGMYKERFTIAQELLKHVPEIIGVVDKSVVDATIESKEALAGEYAKGTVAMEYGNKFSINWVTGQKTGFFIDQRENRKLLEKYAHGKTVLNTFCYSGGFSVFALQAGAAEVHSLDSSAGALELVVKNLEINKLGGSAHKNIKADAVEHIKEIGEIYDIIILDPPAFAKSLKARHKAIQAYKRLNAGALKRIKPGGILFTFSCSQVVDKYLFNNTIAAAAMEAGREVKILEQLHQPADHPVSVFHPEGEYLKGLVLYVA